MTLQRIKPHLPWITLLILIGLVGMVDPNFLRPTNLLSLAGDIVPLFIMALGLTFAIYIGSIDLSVQSMANMVTVIASVYLASMGAWVAVLCIAVGFCLGLLSGFLTTRAFVPSFISTLAVGGICFSLAQFLSGNRALHMDVEQRNALFGWMIGRTCAAGLPPCARARRCRLLWPWAKRGTHPAKTWMRKRAATCSAARRRRLPPTTKRRQIHERD